VLPEGVFYKL